MSSSRLTRGKQILHEEGLLSFFKHAASFLLYLLFVYSVRDVYERRLDDSDDMPIIPCKVDNVALRTITCLEEFDKLLSEGLDLSWYEMSIQQCKERLGKGAILFCALVGKEVAYVSWAGTSKKTHGDFYASPIDYEYEASIGGTMTVPKQRGKGIHTWASSSIHQYLGEKGYSKALVEIHKNNIAARKAQDKLGSKGLFRVFSLRLLSRFNFMWVKPISKSSVMQ